MTANDVRKMLPNIGDRVKGGIVTQVNAEHLWFQIKKEVNGVTILECFKLPDESLTKQISKKDTSNWTLDGHKKLVRCINTGKIFKRCEDAGKEYGISKHAVQRAARTGARVGENYYMFEYVSHKAGDISA